MFSTAVSVLLSLTGVTLLFHCVGMLAALRYTRRMRYSSNGNAPALRGGASTADRVGGREPSAEALPPVTLLKPIKGLEDQLEQNLRSFYEQDYPGELQLVFTSTEASDPGMALARRVAEDYPRIATTFVLARDDFGMNPKVSNMRGGIQHARHDLVLQSDANVRLPAGHLRKMVSQKLAQNASLLGSLVVGIGEDSVAATLENLQLTAFTAPGVCTAKELVDITCVLGKAMLFSRREFDSLGGLAAVKDVLAEDFLMCQLYVEAGKHVVLSSDAVQNVNVRTRWPQFFARHSRWMKMRVVASLPGFIADLGANPLPFALLAWLASGLDARLLPVIALVWAYKCAWDALLMVRLRGHGLGAAQLWATPLRDLALTLVWGYALFSRTTEWRGRKLRLGPGTRLLPDEGALPQRLLRRLGVLRG